VRSEADKEVECHYPPIRPGLNCGHQKKVTRKRCLASQGLFRYKQRSWSTRPVGPRQSLRSGERKVSAPLGCGFDQSPHRGDMALPPEEAGLRIVPQPTWFA
jgi:hypothetical protein